jgi:hypothetical protein
MIPIIPAKAAGKTPRITDWAQHHSVQRSPQTSFSREVLRHNNASAGDKPSGRTYNNRSSRAATLPVNTVLPNHHYAAKPQRAADPE